MFKRLLLACVFTLPFATAHAAGNSQTVGNNPAFTSITLSGSGSSGDATAFTATSAGSTVSLGSMLGSIQALNTSALTTSTNLSANPVTVGASSIGLGTEIATLATGISANTTAIQTLTTNSLTTLSNISVNLVTVGASSVGLGTEIATLVSGVSANATSVATNASAIQTLTTNSLTASSNLTSSPVTVNATTTTLGAELTTLAAGGGSSFTTSTDLTSNPITVNASSVALGTEVASILSSISALNSSNFTASTALTANPVTVNATSVALGTELGTLATGLGTAQTSLTNLTASQSQSFVLAAPAGAAGAPSYRQLTTADVTNAVSTTQLNTAIAGLSKTVQIVTSGSTATMLSTNSMIKIALTTPGVITVSLPSSPVVGQHYLVKDAAGNAQTYPITVTAPSGTIDNAASATLNVNYEDLGFMFDGTNWSTI